MAWGKSMKSWAMRLAPILVLLILFGLAIAIVIFLPPRGAAALVGILAGASLSYGLIAQARKTVRIAVLWAGIAVTADAAYARLNDQTPVTLANALMKIADAAVKLSDPLIRGLGLTAGDPRVKVGAVAPDFVWALVLSLITLIAIDFAVAARQQRR